MKSPELILTAKRKLPYAKILKASLDLDGVKFKCKRNTCNM